MGFELFSPLVITQSIPNGSESLLVPLVSLVFTDLWDPETNKTAIVSRLLFYTEVIYIMIYIDRNKSPNLPFIFIFFNLAVVYGPVCHTTRDVLLQRANTHWQALILIVIIFHHARKKQAIVSTIWNIKRFDTPQEKNQQSECGRRKPRRTSTYSLEFLNLADLMVRGLFYFIYIP